MRLGLKVDVDTLRGTLEGVPALVDLLRRHGVLATFLFSLGRDHTGRAIRRALRPGFVGKVHRTSVLKHYGLRTLLYGTLLPGPDIGRRGADVMRAVRDLGHETGVHCHDHVRWQDGVARADEGWTAREMTRACERYQAVFGVAPPVHGAAGWQMNVHALRLTQQLGFDYCSDGRGTTPHLPVWRGELIRCPQLPTTLPTLDELIGMSGVDETNVADYLLAVTADPPHAGNHVFTLHAELEGLRLAPVLDRLIGGWKDQGYAVGPVREAFEAFDPFSLPRCEALQEEVPGRTGTLLVQGPEFLGDVDELERIDEPVDVGLDGHLVASAASPLDGVATR
jgi:peptidoglycan/xylan/chitin deacetylase (PgdA/CDA1 family)